MYEFSGRFELKSAYLSMKTRSSVPKPYPAIGQPIPGTAVPEKMPAPAAPAPAGK